MEEYLEKSIDQGNPNSGLVISGSSIEYLNETRKWAKFLSVLGFILCGFLVLGVLSVGAIGSFIPSEEMRGLASSEGFILAIVYLLMGLLYFFPSLYLFKFSQKLKTALAFKNGSDLNEALSNHKSFFKFIGIFTIVTLALYLMIGLFAVMAAIFS